MICKANASVLIFTCAIEAKKEVVAEGSESCLHHEETSQLPCCG